ncbi:aminoacyl-tRNA hydrolase [Dissulfurirhabdus thermomarina]|uniref:Aminoacyl-tRNA hydrolase n=1 Tax=Dissulfurirhabdus thermomarina TaxID=1765737 RepID=A0A6N9TSD6_DISTH|nr:aminoacyl-tRNA hydrolase [Dissulfurirhabdus thermomarina]NMX23441.1 aminoacyl-tRNA hydrolase [Dissulfurirhabdus thermomarina]
MIRVTPHIVLHEADLEFRFVRAPGPGGQHVNTAATAVQLRFDVDRARGLPDEVRRRLRRAAGRRLSAGGVLVIEANRFRSQARNREDALARLVRLIQGAAERPAPRKATRPTRTSRRRRLEAKRRRSHIKRLRRPAAPGD